MIQRHSSRRSRLDETVLSQRLNGAASYDRIAGFFRSSLFEVAGEAINSVSGPVRIIRIRKVSVPLGQLTLTLGSHNFIAQLQTSAL